MVVETRFGDGVLVEVELCDVSSPEVSLVGLFSGLVEPCPVISLLLPDEFGGFAALLSPAKLFEPDAFSPEV